jgi:hypothetical protein
MSYFQPFRNGSKDPARIGASSCETEENATKKPAEAGPFHHNDLH